MQIKIVKIPQSITDVIDRETAGPIVGIILQKAELDKEQNAKVPVMEITTRLLENHYMKAQIAFAKLGLKQSTLILRPGEYRIM